jgi:hypothetical protein
MITAKNYAAQAQFDMYEFIHYFLGENNVRANRFLDLLSAYIDQSEHFAMPDGGSILTIKDFGIIHDSGFRIPYETITVEYASEDRRTKHLIIAREMEINEALNSLIGEENHAYIKSSGSVCCTVITGLSGVGNYWNINPVGLVVPQAQKEGGDNAIVAIDFVWNTDILGGLAAIGERSSQVFRDQCVEDMKENCLFPICNLVQALTCTNVTTSKIQEENKKNEKRRKEGKLPFYETKTLVIKTDRDGKSAISKATSSHRPPRQHLRRGHIRRLENKNVWVNACVVGDLSNGSLMKSYSVH